jgi:phenylpyruvate tautomerase PptA (4-oxalocrotonate tautomerase family)
MPKYQVSINELIQHSVSVWAEDTDEAIEQAKNTIINGLPTDLSIESIGLDDNSIWVEEIEGDN